MVYFTSDLHLGHPAIIGMQNRPFGNVEEMNQVLLENYNSVVHKNDTVYILGDISHRLPVEKTNELIAKLNGICFALMHYPMLSWPNANRGSIQLHGHIHSYADYNLQNRKDGIRRYDVGVDANGFKPVAVKDVIDFFEMQAELKISR